MKKFYSLPKSSLADIADYLNTVAKKPHIKIIAWQVIPIKLGGVFSAHARYSCMIEYETEIDKEIRESDN